jgi:hypothetical protein
MGSRRDPRRLVHAHAHVALVAHSRLTCVQAHANANGGVIRPAVRGECPLGREGSTDSILRPRKGDEERIALRVDLLTPGGLEGLSQDPVVLGQHVAVPVAKLLEQTCRSLDVREEEGDRSSREITHGSLRRGYYAAGAEPRARAIATISSS